MSEHVQQFLDQSEPEIILLMIGTTNIEEARGSSDIEDALDDLDTLITKITTLRPFTYIIVSTLPPHRNASVNEKIDESFNPFIASIVENHALQGRRVTFTDVNGPVKKSIEKVSSIGEDESDVMRYNVVGTVWASAVRNLMKPDGDDNKPGILAVRGREDRRHVTVTFTKPIDDKVIARKSNFRIDNDLEIWSVELSKDKRSVTLKCDSLHLPGTTYSVTILNGATANALLPPPSESLSTDDNNEHLYYDDDDYYYRYYDEYYKYYYGADIGATYDELGPMKPEEVTVRFTPGWRFISLADLHVAEKYVFDRNELQQDNDVKIVNFLKKNYGGDFVMITGDTNAGYWDKGSLRESLSEYIGEELTHEDAVLQAGNRCYSGLYSSFREGGYWNMLMAFGDHEGGK